MYIRAAVNSILNESHDFQLNHALQVSSPAEVRTLSELANSQYADVREAVARNKYTPEKTIRALLHDSNIRVRGFARRNDNAPEDFKNIDPNSWRYSNLFEYKLTIYYPDTCDFAYCCQFIKNAVRDFVTGYSYFEYLDGEIYREPDRDYCTFIFTCRYNNDNLAVADIMATQLSDDLWDYILDLCDDNGGEYSLCSIRHTQLLAD